MKNLKDYNAKGVPERMNNIEYVPTESIFGIEVKALDYELFVSTNNAKYTHDNATGVHIVLITADGKEPVRICTHAKAVVRAFKGISHDGIDVKDVQNFTLNEIQIPGKGKAIVIQ